MLTGGQFALCPALNEPPVELHYFMGVQRMSVFKIHKRVLFEGTSLLWGIVFTDKHKDPHPFCNRCELMAAYLDLQEISSNILQFLIHAY